MVTNNVQLSGWGHYAEPVELTLYAVGVYMAGQKIDLTPQRENGAIRLTFSDGTVLKYMETDADGFLPALTDGITLWSVPAEGTTIPNGLDYVTIYASYTTRKGKVINAPPKKIPVLTPTELRIIVPEEPLVFEGYHTNIYSYMKYISTTGRARFWGWNDTVENDVEYRGINSAFFGGKAYFVVVWTDTDGKITKITDCDDSGITIPESFSSITDNVYNFPVVSRNTSATFMRYRSKEDEGEELTIADAGHLRFSYTVNKKTLTCDTYCEINAIVEEGLFNLKKKYDGTESYTIDVDRNAKVVYRNGKVVVGRYAFGGNLYLPIWIAYWDWMGYMIRGLKKTITLSDGRSGNLEVYARMRFGSGVTNWWVWRNYSYSCANGEVTWTYGDSYLHPKD